MSVTEPFTAPTSPEDVKRYIEENDIEFLFAQFVDMHGKPNAKLVPARQFDGLMEDGAGFAGFAAGAIGQFPHDPDLAAMPDVRSFTPLPWKPGVARLACDVHVEGEEWPYCPRTILRRQLDRARELGYEFMIGAELEYFLVRETEDGGIELADPLDRLDQPCYDMRGLTRNLDFISQVARNLTDLGWNNYATDHEDANGQFEQNFDFADALTTADRAIFFRYMVESLAQERGMIATFMPKPFGHLTGNGCHFHMSLWKDGENVFECDPSDDPRGLGLTETAYQFIGGLKAHAKAYIALTAPTVGSYKRLVTGTRSGSSWAPVFVSYGFNNRTQMLRIPAAGPDRGPDGGRVMQPVPRRHGGAGGRPRRDRERPRRRRPDHRAQPPRGHGGAAQGARRGAAAGEPARRDPRAGEGRRAARGARQDRARGLRGLLREDQAGRVGGVAQRGHSLGDQALPAAVLVLRNTRARMSAENVDAVRRSFDGLESR